MNSATETNDKNSKHRQKFLMIDFDMVMDRNLTEIDKYVFAEIETLDNDNRGCFSSNGYLAARLGICEKTVSRAIKALKDNGYIQVRNKKSKYRSIKIVPPTSRFTYYKDENGIEKKELSLEYEAKMQEKRVKEFFQKKEAKPEWEVEDEVDRIVEKEACPSMMVVGCPGMSDTSCPANNKSNIERDKEKRNSSKEEIAEADGASCEAEQQDTCQHNQPCDQDNDTWDSEINNLEEMNIEKQKLYSRDLLYEMNKYEVKDFLVSEGVMSEYDNLEDIHKYIEPEEKVKTSCDINNTCAPEKEQEVEVNTQIRPKVKNGTTTLTHKLADEWENLGFKKVKQDELKHVKNNTDAFLCGSVFELNNIEKVAVTEDSFFQALKNRKQYIDSLIGKERNKQLGLCISYWLWNPKVKSKNKSQFLIDLSGYDKKVTDEYPELTVEIKKAYIKTFLGGLGGIDWSLQQEENFIKASKKVMKFLAENRKRLRSHWLHPKNNEIARWLVNSILESKNGVTKGVNTNYLCNKITIGESFGNYLESEAILNKRKD